MKIILYKNCILTSEYKDVFKNEEILNNYLETLNHFELDLDDLIVYPRFNDNIIIESNLLNIFNYNYAKIINDDNTNITPFYVFIDNIDIINGLITIEYSQDIWHSFFNNWKIKDGILSSTKFPLLYNVDEYKIPIEYASNKDLIFRSEAGTQCFVDYDYYYFNNIVDGIKYFNGGYNVSIYLSLQLFKIVSGGDNSEITPYIFYLGAFNMSLNYDDVYETINKIIRAQSNGDNCFLKPKDKSWNESENWSYTLDKIYVIPTQFDLHKYVEFTNQNPVISSIFSDKQKIVCSLGGVTEASDTKFNGLYKLQALPYQILKHYYIDYDPKNIGYGLYSFIEEINNNGKDTEFTLSFSCDNQSLHIYMENNKQIKDIIDYFTYEPEFSVITADVAQQRRIARNTAIAKGILSLGTSVISGSMKASAIGQFAKTPNLKSSNASIQNTLISNEQLSHYQKLDAIGSVNNVGTSIIDIFSAITPSYSTGYNVDGKTDAFSNAIRNFGSWKLDPLNENEVNMIIEKYGYKTNYICNKILDNIDGDYDYISFSIINLYGSSSSILSVIKEILLNGTRIRYSTNVQDIL